MEKDHFKLIQKIIAFTVRLLRKYQTPSFMIWKEHIENDEVVFTKVLFQ